MCFVSGFGIEKWNDLKFVNLDNIWVLFNYGMLVLVYCLE